MAGSRARAREPVNDMLGNKKEMDISSNKTAWKLKWKMCKSAVFSLLLTTLAFGIPLRMLSDYRNQGYIYVAKGGAKGTITATGNNALVEIYGLFAVFSLMWIIAVYYLIQRGRRILKSELPNEIEFEEVVICTKCGAAQKSKDLTNGHCNKCKGIVDNVEGFYDRHPWLKRKH